MSSKTRNLKRRILLNSRDGLAVHGYLRNEFTQKLMIDVIIDKIILFYMNNAGSLYVFGGANGGKLGLKEYMKLSHCPTPTICVPFDKGNALSVVAGYRHTLILNIDGNVWTCGTGAESQTRTRNNANKNVLYIPKKLKLNVRVISLCAGYAHTLLLCDNGWVQSFGSNWDGQLGHGNLPHSASPKTIEKLDKYKIIQISAGNDHSMVLTDDYDLYCFGKNSSGQSGVGKKKGERIKSPTKVDLDDDIVFVDCGDFHSLLITKDCVLYSFGWGHKGRLGHGDKLDKDIPTLVEALKGIETCAAGGGHSLCMDKDGLVWSFGDNYWGQCAASLRVKQRLTPMRIDWFIENNIKAMDCFAGGFTSSVLGEDECLYVFGSNMSYQLGLEKNAKYHTPTKLSLPQNTRIKSISMGCEHSGIIV